MDIPAHRELLNIRYSLLHDLLQAFESQLKETGALCNRLENRTFASTLSCENRIFVLRFGFGNSTTFSGTLINNEFVTGMYTVHVYLY